MRGNLGKYPTHPGPEPVGPARNVGNVSPHPPPAPAGAGTNAPPPGRAAREKNAGKSLKSPPIDIVY